MFGGKCLSKRFKNRFPTLVETVWLNGGLNHMMFLRRFRLLSFLFSAIYLKSIFLYPLFFNAVLYSSLDELKISEFEEFLLSLYIYIMMEGYIYVMIHETVFKKSFIISNCSIFQWLLNVIWFDLQKYVTIG